jgi:integrase
MKKRLTDAFLKTVKRPAEGFVAYWDTESPLGVRVTPSVIAFHCMYRVHGKQARERLGRYPGISLTKARKLARDRVDGAKAGIDPRAEKRAAAAQEAKTHANNFGRLAGVFLEGYAKKRKTWQVVEATLTRDLAPWRNRPVTEITKADVKEALRAKLKSAGPYASNRLLAHTRRLFNWMMEEDYLAASPCAGVKPLLTDEEERERTLTETEIATLWKAWDGLGWFGSLCKLLLVTGCRRNEIAAMKWTDIRTAIDDNEQSTLHLAETKNGRPHDLPLSGIAMEILDALPRYKSEYVFAAAFGDRPGHVSGFSRAKRRCDELSGITGWRLHDLRRSVATYMVGLAIPLETVGKVLNHAPAGVTAKTYVRHSYAPEMRRALETWARKLQSIVRPTDDNVVQLRA